MTDRNAADSQHHFVSLIAPSFADPSQHNLAVTDGGTVSYRLAPVSTETPGTYTVGVWVKSKDEQDQFFPLQDLQIGTGTVARLRERPRRRLTRVSRVTRRLRTGRSTCTTSIRGSRRWGTTPSTRRRSAPATSATTTTATAPTPPCGRFMASTAVRISWTPASLTPSTTSPRTPRWPPTPTSPSRRCRPAIRPTRTPRWRRTARAVTWTTAGRPDPRAQACGTCHDNLFFDTGTLQPPRIFGKPSGAACTASSQCTSFGSGAVCNAGTGNCERTAHAVQPDDAQCATCHGPTNGVSPIEGRHAIATYLAPISLEGFRFDNVTVTGGSGPGGSFQVNDTVTLRFQLFDNQATPASVPDLNTNGAWAGTFLVAGPTSNPQRVFGSAGGGLNMKTTGTLGYDAPSETYTYVPPGTWPASSLAPINNAAAGTQPNPAGNYTVWFYWARTTSGTRDAVDTQLPVAFGVNQTAAGRQVVTQAACGSCHGMTASGFPHLALHGGQRKNGETCSTCHTQNAFDRGVGSTGIACTVNSECPGFAGGWEACNASVCTVTVDPTPGIVIDYQQLVHDIHFARLREGYLERNNLGLPPAIPPKPAELPRLQQQPERLPGDPRSGGRAVLHQLPPGHRRQLFRLRSLRLRAVVPVGEVREHRLAESNRAGLHHLPRRR